MKLLPRHSPKGDAVELGWLLTGYIFGSTIYTTILIVAHFT